MKTIKIIIKFLLFLSVLGVFQANAANYNAVNIAENTNHAGFWKIVIDALKTEITTSGQFDINKIRRIVNDTIALHWGWHWNKKEEWSSEFIWLARVENGKLIISCFNMDLANIWLENKYCVEWEQKWTDCEIYETIDECSYKCKQKSYNIEHHKPVPDWSQWCPASSPAPLEEKDLLLTKPGCTLSWSTCWDWVIQNWEECEKTSTWWVDWCNKKTCKLETIVPSIKIEKTDSNPNDLDQKVWNDTQTVKIWSWAIFKIRVTNIWNESLKNIRLSDEKAATCSWEISVLSWVIKAPWYFSWFTIWWETDFKKDMLEPDEYYEYECVNLNTSWSYTNVIDVTWVWNSTNKTVTWSDSSKVLIGWDKICWTSDWHNFSYDDEDWWWRTFCSDWSAPVWWIPNFPWKWESVTWTCKSWDTESVCKATRNLIEFPWLKVYKTDNNTWSENLDLDLFIWNDVQIIKPWERAKFKIRIINNFNEDIKNISVVDSEASNCERSNITLKKWEAYEYTCEWDSRTTDYVNTAKVTWISVDTNTDLNSKDTSKVVVTDERDLKCETINYISKVNNSTNYMCIWNILTNKIWIDCDNDWDIDEEKVPYYNWWKKIAMFTCWDSEKATCYVWDKISNWITTSNTTSNSCKIWAWWTCWDGIIQRPNSNWQNEECDKINWEFPEWCDSNTCKTDDTTIPDWGWYSCNLWVRAYANNRDINTIWFTVNVSSGALENWTRIANLWIAKDFEDLSNVSSDRINQTNEKALSYSWILKQTLLPWGNEVFLEIAEVRSIAPLNSCDNMLKFTVPWLNRWNPITIWDVWYYFRKPYLWKLWVTDWTISVWTKSKYELLADGITSKTPNNVSNIKIDMDASKVSELWENISLQETNIIKNLSNPDIFETRINTSSSAVSLNREPWIQVKKPIINYTIDWKNVRYYLSENDEPEDESSIKIVWNSFLGIKIVWWLQWDGKYEFTWQNRNISDLSSSEQRSLIRKNAYNFVSSMSPWTKLSDVKYIKWDITISWDQDYETLVVVDGNVIIEGTNLNPSNKKLWIIVLKDQYDVNKDYNNKWNVYVKWSVRNINAVIYADGWFISADNTWKPYIVDSSQRTIDLQEQLIMNWSLFTRNTIWWAIYKDWYYLLPGWMKLYWNTWYDKAMVYDLNYIRRWNKWCDKNNNQVCSDSWEFKEWFVIKYDSRIQTNPPKLFTK